MLTLAGALTLLIWLYLLFGHGRFWRVGSLLSRRPQAAVAPARVAVIIPARDEAAVVGQSVASLLQQEGGHTIQIFLVDDASSDQTAEIARQAALVLGASQHLTVSLGTPLPSGWSGKLWAVHQGVEKARELHPDFFLLTDADIAHAPDSIAALV